MSDFNIQELALELEQLHTLDFAYVLGSGQDGTIPDGSDLDVAVMFSPDASGDYDAIAAIHSASVRVAPDAECDVIRLNTAGVQMRYESLQGRLLFVGDDAQARHAEFYSRTCREWEDAEAWRQKQCHYRGWTA
jgi:hypothetical protein